MIQVERVGAVLTIMLDRPEVRNAMSGALCANVTEVLAANADARAIILTGSGSAFCAGADLASRFGAGDGQGGATDTFRPNFEIMLDAMNDHQAPVIAAINGAAIGAGMQLIVACDLRVARPSAKLAIPAVDRGIMLSPANIARLASLVGIGMARDFLLTGRQVIASDAVAMGLIQRIDDEPLAAAHLIAAHIVSLAPLAVSGHKHALNLVAQTTNLEGAALDEVWAIERAAFASDDLAEGMAAFAEKRDPIFRGR